MLFTLEKSFIYFSFKIKFFYSKKKIELKETYRGYKTMDDQSRQEFQSRQSWLQLLDQPNPNFSQFTQVPQLDAFINANKDEILALKKHAAIINKIMNEFIRPSHDSLVQTLDSISVDQMTQKIVMREKTQAQIFDLINEKFGDKFNDFEDKVKKFIFLIILIDFKNISKS